MENKKEQLLIISPPNELRFRGPFSKPVVTIMKLANDTDQIILFKIKTTAPRKYCVRPNFGAVEPRSVTEVEICLQGNFAFDPTEKNKHKFMVQSFVVPEGAGATDHLKLWKNVQPEQLMDSKLKCVFELPADTPIGDTSGTLEEKLYNKLKSSGFLEFGKEEVDKDELPQLTNDEKAYESDVTADLTFQVRSLRESESLLRQENLKLKEQIIRLRLSEQKVQPTSSSQYQNPYSPPQLGQQPISVMFIATAIAMAIVGLILGKYML